MCTHIWTYMYTYTCRYIHIHVHMYVQISPAQPFFSAVVSRLQRELVFGIFSRIRPVCICIYIRWVHINIYIHRCVYHANSCLKYSYELSIYIYIYIYNYIFIHMYVYIHTIRTRIFEIWSRTQYLYMQIYICICFYLYTYVYSSEHVAEIFSWTQPVYIYM